jgi:hypothetical protein
MGESQNAWGRGQATVKLVGRRKQLLEKVASIHAPGCSPVEAIDRALEMATAPQDESDLASRLFAIEALLALVDEARAADSSKVEAQIAKLAASLAGLHSLIKQLAEEQ